jgi:branched-chain amino acid transport system substrate-binding protein
MYRLILAPLARPFRTRLWRNRRVIASGGSKMSVRISSLIGCALLLAATVPATPAPDKTNVLRGMAARLGRVLGAASACPNVARPRIKGITEKFADVVRSSSSGDDESKSILDLFNGSYLEGVRSVNARQMDCGTADRELGDLEAASAPAPSPSPSPQPAPLAAAPAQAAAFATQVAPGSVRGVSDTEIRFGASVPMTGPNKDYGHQIRVGIETAFRQANDAGGVHGRTLRLIAADDGYEPTRTAETMKQLCDKDQVFGFVGNFGTATAMVAAPFALDRQMLFYAGYTGAGVLRRDPPDRYVFNYRASYAEETEAAVRYLIKVRRLKPEQIAVFAQQDAYGDAGFAGVAKAMRTLRGGEGGFILRTGYPRNSLDVDPAIAQLKASKTPIKAVVMVATYRAAAKFIEKTRDAIPGLIYTNPSAVGAISLRDELMLIGGRYAEGVIITQVVPAVDGYSSLILEYKSALAKAFGGEAPDYVSLEYYVATKILIEALKRAGPQPDTEKLVDAFENMRDFDLGLGTPILFGRSEHQGSHKVWGTQLTEAGKFEPFELQ